MWRPLLLTLCLGLPASALPRVEITHDDTVLTRSCRVVIPPGRVLADTNANGVLHVGADGITVEFAPGTELRGAVPDASPDALRGIGIVVDGHHHVTLKGVRVRGYFSGILARHADHLRVDGGDFADNHRQRLQSTPEAEDGSDWLFPHRNDAHEWREQHGGAVCVESSAHVLLRRLRVRRGQNGILLDRVTHAQVYDNDASFLSGWGLALWRSSRNTISRNAFDFCVRGHSEGVYNRGQDSAGILCFEQCNDNVFAENSATHGGDGFFGFAGREAIGEAWLERERERLRRQTGKEDVGSLVRVPEDVARDLSARGCNRNIIVGNDFSYSPAHGFEMTFSEDNVFLRNRVVGNGICGVWGGYSSGTWVVANHFEDNGALGYGLERGAVNMEHASGNRILGNLFRDDRCGVHLWWDDDRALLRNPGVAGNYRAVSDNVIAGNRFEFTRSTRTLSSPGTRPPVGLQLRDDGTNNIRGTVYVANAFPAGAPAVELAVGDGIPLRRSGEVPRFTPPKVRVLGRTRPVGARAQLRGRDQILMDDWGPWEHSGPLLRALRSRGSEHAWEVRGVPDLRVLATPQAVRLDRQRGGPGDREVLGLSAPPGVTRYRLELLGRGFSRTLQGTLVTTRWDATFFPWTEAHDPRQDLDGWRALAHGPGAVTATVGTLDLNYGGRGPRHMGISEAVTQRGPGAERFGMIARTRLPLPAGRWRLATLSDDGVRVMVDGRVRIENWNWHGPTTDACILEQPVDADVSIEVEHFEIDGHAVLQFELSPAP